MKKILAFLLIVSFIFTLAGCGKTSKEDIVSIVEKNYEKILNACKEKDKETLLSIKGITKVNIVEGYVIVFCKGKGISVSSQDYGFYYSEENSPIAVDCNLGIERTANDLIPEGNGYQCIVSGNTFYTENIKGNIYFYSNSY